MKMNVRTTVKRLILALIMAVGFASCSDDSSEQAPVNANTVVKLVFTDSSATGKSAGSKVDLSKVSLVKIEYVVSDANNGINVVNEAKLIMTGDSTKVSTLDRRILNFKAGSKLTIHSASLYDNKENYLGSWSMDEADTFEVTSPQGVAIMERVYGTVGTERK
jgi:PBP1b-binding outer membrane lipoprotein LpoB